MTVAPPLALTAPAAAPLPLLISLIFGIGQCLAGGALVARARGGGRWRRAGTFVAAVLGAWLVCSGVAELVVSGFAFTALDAAPRAAAGVARVRAAADQALLIASTLLLLPLIGYPLWLRLRARRGAADRPREE